MNSVPPKVAKEFRDEVSKFRDIRSMAKVLSWLKTAIYHENTKDTKLYFRGIREKIYLCSVPHEMWIRNEEMKFPSSVPSLMAKACGLIRETKKIQNNKIK